MKVKEIMVRDVKSISPDINVKEALDTLWKTGISGLPVIGENNKLVGMFTEREALAYLLPSYIGQVGKFVYEDNPKVIKKKLAELAQVKISQIMRKDVVTVTQDMALYELARVMVTEKARRTPVVDEQGKVIGMVSRVDILPALIKEAQEASGI